MADSSAKSTESSKSPSFFERLLEHLPYFDGVGRRRLIGGIFFSVGLLLIGKNWIDFQIDALTIKELAAAPLFSIACIFLIYAAGSVIELVGEIFLSRIAAGIAWTIQLPKRLMEKSDKNDKRALLFLLGVVLVPPLMIWGILQGAMGFTRYSQNIAARLTPAAKAALEQMPDRVQIGFSRPFGEFGDISNKYLVDQFEDIREQKWAAQALARPKDILAILTVLLLLDLIWFAQAHQRRVFLEGPESSMVAISAAQQKRVFYEMELKRQMDRFPKQIDGTKFIYDGVDGAISVYLNKIPAAERNNIYIERLKSINELYEKARTEETETSVEESAERYFIVKRINVFYAFQPFLIIFCVGYFYISRSALTSILEYLAIVKFKDQTGLPDIETSSGSSQLPAFQ